MKKVWDITCFFLVIAGIFLTVIIASIGLAIIIISVYCLKGVLEIAEFCIMGFRRVFNL